MLRQLRKKTLKSKTLPPRFGLSSSFMLMQQDSAQMFAGLATSSSRRFWLLAAPPERLRAAAPPFLSSACDRRGTSGATRETHVCPFRFVPPGFVAIFPRCNGGQTPEILQLTPELSPGMTEGCERQLFGFLCRSLSSFPGPAGYYRWRSRMGLKSCHGWIRLAQAFFRGGGRQI